MSAPAAGPPGAAAAGVEPAERGATTIADRVVRRIAAQASREALRAGGSPAGSTAPSATVSRTGRTASVTLRIGVPYAPDLVGTGTAVQQHVARRTKELTGLVVGPPEVRMTALDAARSRGGARPAPPDAGPGPAAATVPAPPGVGPGTGPAAVRRPWSPRRLPVFVVSCVTAAGTAYLLAEAVARRTGHSVLPVAPHPDVLHRVATTSLADPAALVAGIVAVGCGVWLLAVAVLPGLRGRLPMTVCTDRTRAVLDRSAVALLLRDAALGVPGVTSARVRASRRRATVRARAGYGELTTVREELLAAVDETLESLGLARRLRPRVGLRPEAGHIDTLDTGADA